MMGIAIFLFVICSFGFVMCLMEDEASTGLLLLIAAICCFTVIVTMLTIASDCKDYGKFKVGTTFYQCQKLEVE